MQLVWNIIIHKVYSSFSFIFVLWEKITIWVCELGLFPSIAWFVMDFIVKYFCSNVKLFSFFEKWQHLNCHFIYVEFVCYKVFESIKLIFGWRWQIKCLQGINSAWCHIKEMICVSELSKLFVHKKLFDYAKNLFSKQSCDFQVTKYVK